MPKAKLIKHHKVTQVHKFYRLGMKIYKFKKYFNDFKQKELKDV